MSRCSTPRVLISGAARGVGEACARLLAARGAELILTDIDGHALAALAQELRALGRYCDVASESSVAILSHDLAERYGSLDVVINAAGPAYVRSLGLLRLSGALLPCLGNTGRPSLIVNVASSRLATRGGNGFCHAGSREAFSRLSLALGERWRGRSIDVRTVLPDTMIDEVDRIAAEIVVGIGEAFPFQGSAPTLRMGAAGGAVCRCPNGEGLETRSPQS